MNKLNRTPRGQGPRKALKEVEATLGVETNPTEELMKEWGLQIVDDKMDLPPIDWIVAGLIEEKSPTTVVALPKVGKTTVMLFLAILVALDLPGTRFFGQEVLLTKKRVIYFCGEGHRTQVMNRVDALLKQMGKNRLDLGGRMLITDKPWHIGDNRHRAEQDGLTEVQGKAISIVKYFKPKVIFIDPLTRFTRGENEDKSYEMSPITNFIQHHLCRYAAVVIGHHTDKKGRSARGTGDILGFVATELFLDGVPGSNKFTVETTMRNAEAPPPIDVMVAFKTAVGKDGKKRLDTLEVVTRGTKEERNSEEVQEVRRFLMGNPGISTNKLAELLKVGAKKAEALAVSAGATRVEETRGKTTRYKWSLPSDEEGKKAVKAGFKDEYPKAVA